jgi:hypothetical protein
MIEKADSTRIEIKIIRVTCDICKILWNDIDLANL